MKNRLRLFGIYIAIVAIQFFISGSAYISHMNHLNVFFTEDTVTIIALRWNYIAQAFGMLFFLIAFIKLPMLMGNRLIYIAEIVLGSVFMAIALLSNGSALTVAAGLAYNVFIGMYSGHSLTMLTEHIPKRGLGLAFGISYAAGSVGTYMLSLIGKGTFLYSSQVLYIYLIFNIFLIIFIYFAVNIPADISNNGISEKYSNQRISILNQLKLCFYPLVVLILMNAIHNLGSNYQYSVIVSNNLNLPLSRAFYAVGLISAGLIAYLSRRYIALITMACLLYPIITIIIVKDAASAFVMLTLSYLFLGFVSVYRSLLTMDIAAEHKVTPAFAIIGLMISRLVEALSTFYSNIADTNKLMAALLFIFFFVLLLFAFFIMENKNYAVSSLPDLTPEQKTHKLMQKYSISSREMEVLRLIAKGLSNSEIADSLYISENTVKFHVRNLYKKTNCRNRNTLAGLYNFDIK